ncbi:MAG: DUF4293 domain-containing protein [Candidatus Azobacteroides sp.]|nr:DUF4293 domain-containing protein [Candidatus Azobacteroides sp.]
MLQRVQTLYLLGAIVCLMLAFVFPFFQMESSVSGFDIIQNIRAGNDPVLAGVLGVGILLSIITLFLFKNRNLQVKLLWLVNLLILAFYGLASAFYFFTFSPFVLENVKIGVVFPIITFILNLLAIRFIKKDEALIKSLNRIR